MIQRAIDKIDKEMEADENLKAIANYIIDRLITNEENAAKILDKKKSLKTCFDKIKSEAKKLAKNGLAVVADEVVFSWVREYFGVKEPENEESGLFDFDIFEGV